MIGHGKGFNLKRSWSNFAHGTFFTLDAYLALTLYQYFGWPAVIFSPILVGAIGMVAERLLIRRPYDSHAVLLIEHDIDRVLALSDRITVRHQGRRSCRPDYSLWCSPTTRCGAKGRGVKKKQPGLTEPEQGQAFFIAEDGATFTVIAGIDPAIRASIHR